MSQASAPTNRDIEELMRDLILPFYHIKRGTPIPVGERRWENDAEHSWSLAFLACALAPHVDENLDIGLIAQFATVHDIVEVHAGDTWVFADNDDEKQSKDQREAAALDKIRQDYSRMPWIADTVDKYNARDTDEAKFVYALDKYIPVMFDHLDKGRYLREEGYTAEDYARFLTPHREKAQAHPAVGKYYDDLRALIDQHSEYFVRDVVDE